MRNIKLTIEYDGTNYSGWQVQNRRQKTDDRRQKKTIQETIEKALAKVLQEKIKLIGSGRTDAGVHALGQVANFKSESQLACKNIQVGLNSILPCDIKIRIVEDVSLDFHARFSAKRKLYHYSIVNDTFVSPQLFRYAHLVKYPLDLRKMRQASRYLLGKHNFRSFQAGDKKEREAVRNLLRLDLRREKNLIFFDIEADGFLYRMARNIVGTLIEIGRGKLKAQEIKKILVLKDRTCAGPCAPAKGLCLMAVKYYTFQETKGLTIS